jgi:exonuclease SbcD
MTKVVFFSDFHCHIFEEFAKPDNEYVNDRFKAQIQTLQKVFDIARENEATLVFGGDLFHRRKSLQDIVFNSVYEVFAQNNDVETILVRGNHDSSDNTTETRHWLEPFKWLEHVTVFAQPSAMLIGSDVTLYAIPYSDDVPFLKERITKSAEVQQTMGRKSLLVAHIGVAGSETGKYSHRLEGAFTVDDLYPDVFDYVCLGHYHKRQFLAGRDNVFYAGNTIQTSYSDEGQDKGVFLIDLDKGGKPEFIAIPNKKFITLTEVPSNAQELIDNNYVRFVLPKDQAQEVEIFKEDSDNIRVEVQREYKADTRINIGMGSTEEQIVEAYTKEFYPDSTKLALDILKEVKSYDI